MKTSSSVILLTLVVLLSSCSVSGTDDKKAEIQFSVENDLLSDQTLNATFTDGDNTNSFSNVDFQTRDNATTGELASPIVETTSSGKLTVEFRLMDSETEQLNSGGNFQLDLKEDWRYSIYILTDSAEADPIGGCFGCNGYYSFDYINNSSSVHNDSLYVVWGGNSISTPVEY
jgi:hypothetical protein